MKFQNLFLFLQYVAIIFSLQCKLAACSNTHSKSHEKNIKNRPVNQIPNKYTTHTSLSTTKRKLIDAAQRPHNHASIPSSKHLHVLRGGEDTSASTDNNYKSKRFIAQLIAIFTIAYSFDKFFNTVPLSGKKNTFSSATKASGLNYLAIGFTLYASTVQMRNIFWVLLAGLMKVLDLYLIPLFIKEIFSSESDRAFQTLLSVEIGISKLLSLYFADQRTEEREDTILSGISDLRRYLAQDNRKEKTEVKGRKIWRKVEERNEIFLEATLVKAIGWLFSRKWDFYFLFNALASLLEVLHPERTKAAYGLKPDHGRKEGYCKDYYNILLTNSLGRFSWCTMIFVLRQLGKDRIFESLGYTFLAIAIAILALLGNDNDALLCGNDLMWFSLVCVSFAMSLLV